jgi:hypothetical protein
VYIRVPNVTINGNYATLTATNANTSAVAITADGDTLENITLTAPINAGRIDSPYSAGLVVASSNDTVYNVGVTGTPGAGIYVGGASNFTLDHVYVMNTLADGILIVNGSNNGVVNTAITRNTGDDAISIVTYAQDPTPVHDIVVNNPAVYNAYNTRGLVVVGGQHITFNNITVSGTALSGVFVGSQGDPFYTASTNDVVVNGGTVTNANWGTGIPLGALTTISGNPQSTVSNVTYENLSIVEPYTPYQNIVNAINAGAPANSLTNVTYKNIAIQEQQERAVFYTNDRSSITATNITINGHAPAALYTTSST